MQISAPKGITLELSAIYDLARDSECLVYTLKVSNFMECGFNRTLRCHYNDANLKFGLPCLWKSKQTFKAHILWWNK